MWQKEDIDEIVTKNTSSTDDGSSKSDKNSDDTDSLVNDPKSFVLYRADPIPEPVIKKDELNCEQITAIYENDNFLYVDFNMTNGYDKSVTHIQFRGATLCDSKGNIIAQYAGLEGGDVMIISNQTKNTYVHFPDYDLSNCDLDDVKTGNVKLEIIMSPFF